MISKAKIKLIRSLEQKKNRLQHQLFVAEGPKVVNDLLKLATPKHVFATAEWIAENQNHISNSTDTEWCEITETELQQVSFLQHPQQVIALFPIRTSSADPAPTVNEQQLTLMLDGVQDPGNLGTIIRIADWFGINQIICSEDTADVYNPKVVQATMGSIARVDVSYTHLPGLLASLPESFPIYGTLLDGDNLYGQELTPHGIIIMGNEGNGISTEVKPYINHKLFIPNYPLGRPTADSLNVAIATAVTCAEFRRKT